MDARLRRRHRSGDSSSGWRARRGASFRSGSTPGGRSGPPSDVASARSPAARVDAALGRRLLGSGRRAEDRAAELRILRQHAPAARRILRARPGRCPRRRSVRPRALRRGSPPRPASCRRAARSAYCTGAPVPMTGDRGSDSGLLCRTSGYSCRAARLPPLTFRSTGPAGLPAAIGASRPSRASVSVPRV